MKSPVILVTVGHSGSSAVMQILSQLGMFIGKVYKLSHKNYYENVFFLEKNLNWIGRREFRLSDHDHLLSRMREVDVDVLREEARREMERQGLGEQVWGWKDPRTILTFPVWHRVFPDSLFVFLSRRNEDLLLDKVLGKPGRLSFALSQFEIARSIPEHTFDLHYDEMSDDFNGTVGSLCEAAGLSVTQDDLRRASALWRPKYGGKWRRNGKS